MDFLKGFKIILLVTQELTQSFKIVALLLLTDSGGYVMFTLKYIMVGGEGGGYQNFFQGSKLILLVIHEPMQNFKIVALLLLG